MLEQLRPENALLTAPVVAQSRCHVAMVMFAEGRSLTLEIARNEAGCLHAVLFR